MHPTMTQFSRRSLRRACAVVILALAGCSHADRPTPPTAPPTIAPPGTDEPDAPDDTPPTETPPVAAFVAGPGGVPLPNDATARADVPNAGGKMFVYEVPRSREVVSEELRANLAADGWTIDAEEVSPRFGALRLKVSKAGATVDVRVAGDAGSAGIIVTLK